MKILITGAGGYVGCELAKELLNQNHNITALDLFLYGDSVLTKNENLKIVRGDIRNQELLKKEFKNQDIIIHLACISNDPSFELNPVLGKSINLDAFEPMVKIAKDVGVKRFIYASSSSVYGVKKEMNVHEDMKLEPLTDYSKYKALCEDILLKYTSNNFVTTILRPATVCGFSMRQRLDLVVNILTSLAYYKKEIVIFGGEQLRPNIHIKDMIRAYITVINASSDIINGNIFNVGFQNLKVKHIAENIRKILGDNIKIIKKESDDDRSYHISSEKFKSELLFKNQHTVEEAVKDLCNAFESGILQDPLNNIKYYNIKLMNSINLK
jgi:nucleoside-diphosphate-sugar epimerase